MKSWLRLTVLVACCGFSAAWAAPRDYFAIQIVDDATGRGVPLVELQTTSSVRYYSDSNGLVAFNEPGLMGREVWFDIRSPGYEFPPDGFGMHGAAVEPRPGGSVRLKIRRLNVAERLYRITGQGIYRDTVLLGRKPPIREPLLNAQVTGQDSVMSAIYAGKLYWFFGDTSRISYPLGNFAMSGATSPLPDHIDPSVAVDLKYFTDKDGFSRPMAPRPGEGVVWLSGLTVLPDASGRERMLAYFERRRGLGAVLEAGFMVYDDARDVFEKVKEAPLHPILWPRANPFRTHAADGYVYFCAPYPNVRVRANEASYLDLPAYEGYTCLQPGTRYGSAREARLERDMAGKLVWAWKRGTPPLESPELSALIAAGKLKPEESPFRLQDAETGKPIALNNASCNWNAYRRRYVLIASELGGATNLGEVWYSEAEHPEGPWVGARKIITHANKPNDAHDFYNPTQHPFFDRNGGRTIYLEGTYVNTFSGNPHPTPYYEYNQIMYRLDLSDPRLHVTGRGTGAGS